MLRGGVRDAAGDDAAAVLAHRVRGAQGAAVVREVRAARAGDPVRARHSHLEQQDVRLEAAAGARGWEDQPVPAMVFPVLFQP